MADYVLEIDDGDSLVLKDGALDSEIYTVIEDWESGTRDPNTWSGTDIDFTGSSSVHTGADFYGDYGLDLSGFYITTSHPTWPNPLPRYPQAGDVTEYHFKIHSGLSNVQYWLGVGVTNPTYGNFDEEPNNCYSVEAIPNSNAMRISRRQNGSRTLLNSDYASATVNWTTGTWYRWTVDWRTSNIIVTHERWNGSDWVGATQIESGESIYDDGGIFWRVTSGGRIHVDDIRIVPDE